VVRCTKEPSLTYPMPNGALGLVVHSDFSPLRSYAISTGKPMKGGCFAAATVACGEPSSRVTHGTFRSSGAWPWGAVSRLRWLNLGTGEFLEKEVLHEKVSRNYDGNMQPGAGIRINADGL
jgi:hypothetical protein